MALFRIFFMTRASTSVEVEAEDFDSALEEAWEEANRQLCHHCARTVELGDDWEPDNTNYMKDGEHVEVPKKKKKAK